MLEDIRYALRGFRRNPGLTAIAILSLALAVGPNAAVFSLVDAVLLRPLPIRNPDRLVLVEMQTPRGGGGLSWPDYRDLAGQTNTLADLVAYEGHGALLRDGASREAVPMTVVTENYFSALGVSPAIGRLFLPERDTNFQGSPPAVISYGLWQRRFGGDAGVVGKTVTITERPFTLIGVTARDFRGVDLFLPVDVWIPFSEWKVHGVVSRDFWVRRDLRSLQAFGVLRPGATVEQAAAEMKAAAAALSASQPVTNKDCRITVIGDAKKRALFAAVGSTMVLSAIGLVLMISCFNVAGLLLARNEERRREIAVRLAIGASRRRLIRLLLTESVLLAVAAAGLGLLLASWLMELGSLIKPALPISFHLDVRMDWRMLIYTLGVSVLTAIVFGLAPALRASKPDLVGELKRLDAPAGRLPARSVLAAFQVALAQFLLASAALLMHSYWNVVHVYPGFDPDRNVLVATAFQVPSGGGARPVRNSTILERLSGLPGVRAAAVTRSLPLAGFGMPSVRVSAGGREEEQIRTFAVGAGYFRIMGTRIVRGREFDALAVNRKTVVVNETVAARYWPGGDPLGQWLRIDGADFQVIGVAEDGKYAWLRDNAAQPWIFVPMADSAAGEMTLLVETAGDPRSLAGAVRQELRNVSPDLWVPTLMTLKEHHRRAAFLDRLAAGFVATIGLLGIFLAAVGLHGLVSHSVARRMHEFGVRVALGASRRDVLRLILRQTAWLLAAGIPSGLLLSFGLARYWSSLLLGVRAADPVSIAASLVVVSAIALLASLLPARRALRTDPGTVLRYE